MPWGVEMKICEFTLKELDKDTILISKVNRTVPIIISKQEFATYLNILYGSSLIKKDK